MWTDGNAFCAFTERKERAKVKKKPTDCATLMWYICAGKYPRRCMGSSSPASANTVWRRIM